MSSSNMITLALSKGRIFDETLPLLAAAGIEVLEDPEKSRKLILPTNQPNVRVVLAGVGQHAGDGAGDDGFVAVVSTLHGVRPLTSTVVGSVRWRQN